MAPASLLKIGILGCGKMGQALMEGILSKARVLPDSVFVYDIEPRAVDACVAKLSVIPCASIAEVVSQAEAILICVKPPEVLPLLEAAGGERASKLWISIAAGISLANLENSARADDRVVRVMPNTPALIGKGAAAYAAGKTVTDEDIARVERIFQAVGLCHRVADYLLDAVTGLSGSGPAYVYTIIEALADGGCLMGLPKSVALQLAAQTVAGAAEMVLQTGLHPAVLRDQVTSPGGTTIRGIAAMEEAGLRHALISGVRAAAERSRELGAKS